MKETEFKALMYCGQYVDANLLDNGVYVCSKPFIYSKDETIETMIERGRMMKDMTGVKKENYCRSDWTKCRPLF